MKNLINAITKENRKHLENFISSINQVQDMKSLDTWLYNDLLPKGKTISNYLAAGDVTGHFDALKSYLIGRKEKKVNKIIEREVNRIKNIFNACELVSVKISVEWKRSQMWGSNPKAEAWITCKDNNGSIHSDYVQTGSIGGCGYDKLSTAVAQCLNQFNEVLRPMYAMKDKLMMNTTKSSNHEIFGYGSGYGILPSIEGGVGVSCYPKIFAKLGYNFRSVASGKTFDVFEITKL